MSNSQDERNLLRNVTSLLEEKAGLSSNLAKIMGILFWVSVPGLYFFGYSLALAFVVIFFGVVLWTLGQILDEIRRRKMH